MTEEDPTPPAERTGAGKHRAYRRRDYIPWGLVVFAVCFLAIFLWALWEVTRGEGASLPENSHPRSTVVDSTGHNAFRL